MLHGFHQECIDPGRIKQSFVVVVVSQEPQCAGEEAGRPGVDGHTHEASIGIETVRHHRTSLGMGAYKAVVLLGGESHVFVDEHPFAGLCGCG